MRRWGHSPAFQLRRIQELVASGRYDITDSARRDAEGLTFDESDVVDFVAALAEGDYSHTLNASARPGTFQDVYRRRMHGFPLYAKLQIDASGWAVIISFKRDESV